MEHFTPLSATIGGILIGLAAVLMMAIHGRIAGISGLLSGVLFAEKSERSWRLAFILGLISAPILTLFFTGHRPDFDLQADTNLLIIGGLLVGFGTRLGSGCTSGHGVCGLSRLSPRSMASVVIFMASGMITVSIIKSLVGG